MKLTKTLQFPIRGVPEEALTIFQIEEGVELVFNFCGTHSDGVELHVGVYEIDHDGNDREIQFTDIKVIDLLEQLGLHIPLTL